MSLPIALPQRSVRATFSCLPGAKGDSGLHGFRLEYFSAGLADPAGLHRRAAAGPLGHAPA
ncbi:hypothetical protein PSEUDO8Z_10168 [Pseudomonas sp. 8Z]|nr:hypothetical protein PSEUDO8Z_10168 [Pseudomonas sp. 8Z]